MGLGDAYRKIAEPIGLEPVERTGRRGLDVDTVGSVHLGGDGLDLLAQRRLGRVEEGERARFIGCLRYSAGQFDGPGAAVGEVGGDCAPDAERSGDLTDDVVLALEVVGERIDGHNRRHPVEQHVLDLLDQIGTTGTDVVRVLGEDRRGQWPSGHDLMCA